MQWIVAIAVFIAGIAALPYLIRKTKSSATKGGTGAMVMMIGMAFSAILDPAKKDAVEELERRRESGETNPDASGDAP